MKELAIGGVFLAPMVGYLALAALLYLGLRRFYLREIDHFVWHPALFKLALFIILLTLVSLLLS